MESYETSENLGWGHGRLGPSFRTLLPTVDVVESDIEQRSSPCRIDRCETEQTVYKTLLTNGRVGSFQRNGREFSSIL